MLGGLVSGTFGCAPRGKAVLVSMGMVGTGLRIGMCGANGNVDGRGVPLVFGHCDMLSGVGRGDVGKLSSEGKLKLTVYRDVMRLLRNVVGMRDRMGRCTRFAMALPRLRVARGSSRGRRSIPGLVRGGDVGERRLRGTATKSGYTRPRTAVLVVSSGGRLL